MACSSYCGHELPRLPTRVLDVGLPDSDVNPRLFLSHGQTGFYIALSHCWGKSQILTTTSSTLVERQRGIQFASLSRTFQDAVIATRALGVTYLWIDSLCILQDSPEDWDVESSRMGDIYKNAICTISAAKSADPRDGCFVTRDPRLHRPIRLPIEKTIGSPELSDDEMINANKTVWYPYRWHQPVGPLYKRAWVFQEQALSGRSISFTADTVSWTCLTSTASESLPMGRYKTLQGVNPFQSFQQLIIEHSHRISSNVRRLNKDTRDMYAIWYDMVTDYSRRNLTYQTDRLPALSAVATYMSRILNDKYAAGLWHGDIIRGLLWTCQEEEGKRHRPSEPSIAPSWSWASMKDAMITMDFAKQVGDGMELNLNPAIADGSPNVNANAEAATSDAEAGILSDNNSDGYTDGVEIIAIHCTPAGQNKFGQVADGSITLNGWLRKGVVSLATRDLLEPNSGHLMGGLNLDELPESDLDGAIVWCLFIAWREMLQEDEGIQSSVCLALKPSGQRENEYYRVGLVGLEAQYWDYDCEWEQIILV